MDTIHRDKFQSIGVESDGNICYLNNLELRTLIETINVNTITGLRLALITYLMLDTGIQPHELANLKWKNVHLVNKEMYITNDNEIATRQVDLSNTTVAIISRYRKLVSADNLKTEYLIKGIRKSEKLDSRDITVALSSLGERTGIKVNATILRDTFAINYLERTKDSITLASILGISIYHVNARYKNYTNSNDFLLGDLINGL